jgi:aryl sulfotransferase
MSSTNRDGTVAWPKKTRELQNHHMDSTRWNEFRFRDDDIVIATWAKAGTTWTQQIVAQLIFDGAEDLPVADLSPWVDLRIFPLDDLTAALEAQDHRRILKTHLPVDALVFSPKAKYIYLARDGRDVVWSVYNHHARFTELALGLFNDTPGLVGPPLGPPKEDIVEYFHDWLDGDGYPFWPFWSHVQSWWDIRQLPNVMLLHFNELKADMPDAIRRLARFLEIDIDEKVWPRILEHCSFEYMKSNAAKLSENIDETFFRGGLGEFIHKGINDRWRDMLSPADIAEYERAASEHLSQDCAAWLATGRMPD